MSKQEKKVPTLNTEDKEKSASIMLAINLDSAFKLYSFRIITHDQFVTQTKELISFFTQNIK